MATKKAQQEESIEVDPVVVKTSLKKAREISIEIFGAAPKPSIVLDLYNRLTGADNQEHVDVIVEELKEAWGIAKDVFGVEATPEVVMGTFDLGIFDIAYCEED